MKIEMEFQGLKELMKAFEDAASDEDIKEVNQKIVKRTSREKHHVRQDSEIGRHQIIR